MDSEHAALTTRALADLMGEMWPRGDLDPTEYVVRVRNRLRCEDPNQLCSFANKLLGTANRMKRDLPEASAAARLFAGWLNLISIELERADLASEAFELSTMFQDVFIDLLNTSDGGSPRGRELAAADPRNRGLLEQFDTRLRQHGHGSTSFDERGADARVCGQIAGLFAKLVNGKTLAPSRSYSERDLAVAWVGTVAADMATQATGADLELAGLAIPITLISLDGLTGANAEDLGGRIADFGTMAFGLHNRLAATGRADETAALVAKSFMDWTVEGGDAGLFALRRMLPKIAANIAAMNATA